MSSAVAAADKMSELSESDVAADAEKLRAAGAPAELFTTFRSHPCGTIMVVRADGITLR